MDKRWIILLVLGCFTAVAKAQAEGAFPDYWQDEYESLSDEAKVDEPIAYEPKNDEPKNDEPQVDETVNNDKIINGDEFVDENGVIYSIDKVINSALAEGLNSDEKRNDDDRNDGLNNEFDENNDQIDGIANENVNNEEKVQNIVNSDETRVRDEIESFRKELVGVGDVEEIENEEDVDGNLDDYQFEDNRSEVKEDVRNEVPADNDGSIENHNFEQNFDEVEHVDEVEQNVDEVESNLDEMKRFLYPANLDRSGDVDKKIWNDNENDEENNFNAVLNDAVENVNQVAENVVVDQVEDTPIQEPAPQNDYDQLDYEEVPEKEESVVDYIDGIQEDEIQKFLVEKDNQDEQDTFNEQNIREINDQQELEPESDEDQDTVENLEPDEDTVDKVKADLNEDLERLFDTWNKLAHDSEEEPENVEQGLGQGVQRPVDEEQDLGQGVQQPEDEGQDLGQGVQQPVDEVQDLGQGVQQPEDEGQDLGQGVQQSEDEGQDLGQNLEHPENVEEYENKYGKPYGEDIVLAQRQENIDPDSDEDENIDNIALESNLENILVQHDIAQIEIEDQEIVQNIPKINSEEQVANLDQIDEINYDGESLDENRDIVAGASIFVGDKEEDVVQNKEVTGLNIEIIPDVNIEDVEKLIEAGDEDIKSDKLSNGNDEIYDFKRIFKEENEQEEKDLKLLQSTQEKQENNKLENQNVKKSVDVQHLTSTQYDDLMRQFSLVYADDIEITDQQTEVSKVEIDTHTPITITSPNYPEPYPTDNTVDYYFHGEGKGVEFNITDLELNGAVGDYLLVKPGNSDESGSEGLVFSYHLTEPRTYRFLDVDQLFVRFRSNPSVAGRNGFSFSVKMVAPLPNDTIPEPSPAPLLPPPATLTVYLGGLTVSEFMKVMDDFKTIVADMATMYINSQGIEAGKNTTSEVTQITGVGYCNVNWPNFDVCVQVTFGVPLVYEDADENKLTEEELYDMWSTLFYRDPFAYRLRQLNIEEFSTPNDRIVLRSWLVVASGVVLSAALLAFVLWRFSCFQGYTRMAPFSDTDSIRDEKRNLDLYPTPHQTLPPLYSNEYKWVDDDSTRVDMGGFANRSYTRDELFDIDSDEETAPRDRYTSDV